ncbi:MAG: hypothetical protein AVDCRST_MAG49-147, partial [uncultured Thermomicrobiales bacterium]
GCPMGMRHPGGRRRDVPDPADRWWYPGCRPARGKPRAQGRSRL